MSYKIFKIDPYLKPYESDINARVKNYLDKKRELVGEGSLCDFANGYEYFGIHKTKNGWVYREWAPAADQMFFTGDFNCWDIYKNPMTRLENGVFEIVLEGKDALKVGEKIQTIVIYGGQT